MMSPISRNVNYCSTLFEHLGIRTFRLHEVYVFHFGSLYLIYILFIFICNNILKIIYFYLFSNKSFQNNVKTILNDKTNGILFILIFIYNFLLNDLNLGLLIRFGCISIKNILIYYQIEDLVGLFSLFSSY